MEIFHELCISLQPGASQPLVGTRLRQGISTGLPTNFGGIGILLPKNSPKKVGVKIGGMMENNSAKNVAN